MRSLAAACAEALEKGVAYATAVNSFAVKVPGQKSAVKGIEDWRAAVEEASEELKSAKEENRAA